MSLPHREVAFQTLSAYQDRLDAAHGKAAYDALFDGAPAEIGLHEIDHDKTVKRVNSAELALLGYRREEVVGHPAWRFTVLQETSQRAADKKLAGGGLTPFVRTFKRADGAALTMALVERYLRDASGTIVGIRTALTPIEA